MQHISGAIWPAQRYTDELTIHWSVKEDNDGRGERNGETRSTRVGDSTALIKG